MATPKNTPDLLQLIADNLPDNFDEEITAAKLREVLDDMVVSDNNPNDNGVETFTTFDKDALSALSIAVDALVGFPAYAELYRGTIGLNLLALAGDYLSFDEEGLSRNMDFNSATEIQVSVNEIGQTRHQIKFEGSAMADQNTEFTFFIRVNGIDVREIGSVFTSNNNNIISFSFGALLDLADDDLVSIYAVPSVNSKNFDLQIGSRFTIFRI